MEKHIRDKENAAQKDKARVLTMIKKEFVDTKQALDVAYSAGVLASRTQSHAQEDSLRFAANFPDEQMRGYLTRARKRLELTSTQIDKLLDTNYRNAKVATLSNSFFYHWLEADLDLADKAEELIKQLEYTIKRSYVLAKTMEANPTGLGARPKERPEPGNESKVYPTLEEEAAPAPDRTQD